MRKNVVDNFRYVSIKPFTLVSNLDSNITVSLFVYNLTMLLAVTLLKAYSISINRPEMVLGN